MKRTIYIGHDQREEQAFSIAVSSAGRHLTSFIPIHGLFLGDLMDRGLYRRPIEFRADGGSTRMWDTISGAPMSTQHACARFIAPHLAKSGWVLFIDGDVLVRADLNELFDQLDPEKALYCVQHRHDPEEGFKMDGQLQLRYRRKNWSSVMALNVDHPANAALTVDYINTVPGRELHAFGWLDDKHIGALRQEWNYLVGVTRPLANPKIAHFTLGTPDMPGYEACEYAEEWRAERRRWAA
jgi:hypothetical protein